MVKLLQQQSKDVISIEEHHRVVYLKRMYHLRE
jgi:hypothetical protein